MWKENMKTSVRRTKKWHLERKRENYRGKDKEGVREEVLDGKVDKEEKMELEKEMENGEARGQRGRRSSNSRYRRRTVKTRKKETNNMKLERITITAVIDEFGKNNEEDTGISKSPDITALVPASCEQLPSKGTTKLMECSKCEAMFRSKVGLDRHMREDHVFLCFVCGEKLSDKKEYEVHTATQHCTQVARCLSCRTNFPSYNEFREHQEHCSGTIIAEDTQIKAEGVNTSPLLQKCIISVDHTNICHTEFEVDNNSLQENESCKVISPEQKSKNDTEYSDANTHQRESSQSSAWRIDEQTGSISQTSPKKSEVCPHCGKAFERRSRLLRHINYHFGNKSFKCVTCGKCFVEKGGLVKHELTHDPLHVPCQECGKVCRTRRTLERHLLTHQNKLYTCQVCNKSYKHEDSLRIHKRIHNPHGSGHICVVCEQDCRTAQYLRMHLASRHDGHMLSCHMCTKTFKWKQSLRKHMAMYHSSDGGSLGCGKCEKPMSSKSALEAHKVVHSEARPFSCTLCGKAFKQEKARDRHTAIVHTDQKQFMCPQCGALFKAKSYLSQHISQVHTTSQPSKCMKCNKSFKTKAILKNHIKIVHTKGKIMHTCTLCGKAFLSPKDLARHSKIHTGEKDVICKDCGRQFSRKDNMMAHIRVHHNGNKTVNSKEFSSAAKTSTDLTSSTTVGTSLTTATTSSTSPTVAMAGAPLSTSPAAQPEIITVQTGLVQTGFTTLHTNLAPSFLSGTNGISPGVIGTSGGVPTGVTSPRACRDEDHIYVTPGLASPTAGGLPSCSSSQQIAQVMTDSVSVGGSSVPLALMLGTASPSLPISTGFTASSSPLENTSCLLETGSILIPHPALLQDTPLLVSEKAGVYTVVECGKLSPLETFTLHAAPSSSQASTTLVMQPLPILSSTPASSTTTTTTTTSIISVPNDATTEPSAQMTPALVLTANVVGSSSSSDSGTRTCFPP